MAFINIHIHAHNDGLDELVKDVKQIVSGFNKMAEVLLSMDHHLKTLIMTQKEAVDKLNGITTQVAKVRTEVEALVAAAANADNVSAELQTAIDNVSAAIQGVDDLNPDAPVTQP